MRVNKIREVIKENPKTRLFIQFSIIRAIYGFSVLGFAYLLTEILNIDFEIRTILVPIAFLMLTNRLIKYYQNKKN
ncbi:MAG: hypothetical protein EVA28_00645 [Candidatus Actinomarinales bacterium]|nr:MAG: hypothetical protein EVA28_00645 [Candidatus Actinomarinales bacterium]